MDHPLLAGVLGLVMNPTGAFAGTDPDVQRVRLNWQLARLPWIGVRLVRGIWGCWYWDDPIYFDCSLSAAPCFDCWVSWLDVPDIEATREWSLEGWVEQGQVLPLTGGPDLYLFDVAVGGHLSIDLAVDAVRMAWALLCAERPAARAVGWHRQRADGRRRFARYAMRGA